MAGGFCCGSAAIPNLANIQSEFWFDFMLRYPKLVSLAMPQQIDTNTNCTVHASCPVHTSPFAMSFVWLSRSSVCMGALSPTGYEPSWPLSTAFCVYLCLLCVTLSHLRSFLCHLCLPEVSVGIYLCFSEMICIEKCLCIVSLICRACWASAPCSAPICVCCVEIHLHSGTSTLLLVRGSPNSPLAHFHFVTITTATCHTHIT